MEKAKAELQELEALLAQKQAETAQIAAKVEALRARLATADGQPRRIIVSVDGQNATYADVFKRIQTAQPGGAAGKVIVVDGGTGKIIMTTNGPIPAPPPPPVAISADKQYILRWIGQEGNWVVVPKNGPMIAVPTGAVVPASPADADKRLDELEIKLKRILDEVEQLRKERKPDAPKSESGQHSYGPAPLIQLPVVGKLFRTEASQTAEEQAKALTAERDALQKMLQELRAKAETDKAQGEAVIEQTRAALAAAEATLKQAQAREEATVRLSKAGAATDADLKQTQADVAVRQAELEVARANLLKANEDSKVRQAEIEAKLNAAEADRQAAEAKVRQLEEELRKLKDATNGDAPKRP